MLQKNAALPIPEPAQNQHEAVEIVRVWLAEGNTHLSIRGGIWRDPAAWGLLLVDLARHVANAYAHQGHHQDEVLKRIKEGFDAEWGFPTDMAQGGVVE